MLKTSRSPVDKEDLRAGGMQAHIAEQQKGNKQQVTVATATENTHPKKSLSKCHEAQYAVQDAYILYAFIESEL